MMIPDDYLPEWAQTLLTIAFGAGGVRFVQVWMEQRRLGKSEFRETLLGRIRELEQVVSNMQTRIGNQRVEIAELQGENNHMREKLGMEEHDYKRGSGDVE